MLISSLKVPITNTLSFLLYFWKGHLNIIIIFEVNAIIEEVQEVQHTVLVIITKLMSNFKILTGRLNWPFM